jgi:flagellar M-ring protein FliF
VNGLLVTLRNLGAVRLGIIGLVVAATVGFFAYVGTRMSAPHYGLLYSDLDLRDSGQIVQKLDALNVPYEVKGGGAQILVPSEQVAKLRMAMAEAGLPRGGSVGYELFDKSEGLGTSTFVQNINQVRALEGELARTISSLGAVQGARVHLVLPRREMFSREKPEPSASIALKLRGAEKLSKGQVAGIQQLVAAAVPGLKPAHISIVDNEGNLLARVGADDPEGLAGNAEEMRTAYENRLARTLDEMLERTLGPGKVRTEVHADIDYDRVTTNQESFDPDSQVVRSTQTVTESSDSTDAGDQPVTVANNLPDAQNQKGGAGARSKSGRNEETINYEITKTVKSHVREGGVVRRLSVAVLVDGTYAAGSDGTRSYQPRPQEELDRITTLVRSAIGYDQKRGDVVEVVNLRFANPAEVDIDTRAPLLDLTKEDIFRLGETLVLVMIALLVFIFVVRPMMTRVMALMPAVPAGAGGPALLTDQSTPIAGALPPPAGMVPATAEFAAEAAPGQTLDAIEQMIDLSRVDGRVKASSVKKVGEIVDKHPEEAVAILRSWMYQGS